MKRSGSPQSSKRDEKVTPPARHATSGGEKKSSRATTPSTATPSYLAFESREFPRTPKTSRTSSKSKGTTESKPSEDDRERTSSRETVDKSKHHDPKKGGKMSSRDEDLEDLIQENQHQSKNWRLQMEERLQRRKDKKSKP